MNFQSITVHCTNLTETETNWSAAAAGSHMKHVPAQLITAQPQLDLLLEGTKPSLAAIAMNAGQYFLGVDFFNNLIFLEFLKLINLTTWFFSVTWRLLLTLLQIYQEAINRYTSRYPAFRAIWHSLSGARIPWEKWRKFLKFNILCSSHSSHELCNSGVPWEMRDLLLH